MTFADLLNDFILSMTMQKTERYNKHIKKLNTFVFNFYSHKSNIQFNTTKNGHH